VRPLGVELQCGSLWPLCKGLELGGSSVEERVGQLAGVPKVVMEWMATITGDHVGYPGFSDLGDFSPRRKILGSKNSHVFWCRIFTVPILCFVNVLAYFAAVLSYTHEMFMNLTVGPSITQFLYL
jgi:hypothetical protein